MKLIQIFLKKIKDKFYLKFYERKYSDESVYSESQMCKLVTVHKYVYKFEKSYFSLKSYLSLCVFACLMEMYKFLLFQNSYKGTNVEKFTDLPKFLC